MSRVKLHSKVTKEADASANGARIGALFDLDNILDLGAGQGELLGELARVETRREINEVAEPIQRNQHKDAPALLIIEPHKRSGCTKPRRSPEFMIRMSCTPYFIIARRVRPRPNAKPVYS